MLAKLSYKSVSLTEKSNSSVVDISEVPSANSGWPAAPAVSPRLADLFLGLSESCDPKQDLMAIFTRARNLTEPIDDLLDQTDGVTNLVRLLDFSFEKDDSGTVEDVLRVISLMIGLSKYPIPCLADVINLWPRLLVYPSCVCFVGNFLSEIFRWKKEKAMSLVLEHNFLPALSELIQAHQISREYVGQLFQVLSIVLANLDISWVSVRRDLGPIWEIPRNLIFLYLFSNDPVILPFVLDALDQLIIKWPDDTQNLLTSEVVGRLKTITQNAHKIPDAGNTVFTNVVRIWQRCVHCYSPGTGNRGLLPDLVQTLINQLPHFPAARRHVLFLFSNAAYYPDSGINREVYQIILDRFQDVSFREKESLLLIFCNLAIQHAYEMAELGRCEEFLAAGWETAAAACSPKYVIAFLKAVYKLFSAENDLVSAFHDEEFIGFLCEIAAGEDLTAGEYAQKILDGFYGEGTTVEDLWPC
jgi:hypothetical protein